MFIYLVSALVVINDKIKGVGEGQLETMVCPEYAKNATIAPGKENGVDRIKHLLFQTSKILTLTSFSTSYRKGKKVWL